MVLRAAATGAVLVGIAACRAEGQISTATTFATSLATALGMALSYRTRRAPWRFVKPVLAVATVAVFVWFALGVGPRAEQGQLSAVEGSLATMFAWIQAAHSFDVPARRDLAFSLAGSAALMAVAAVQAVDLSFGLYVLVWAACGTMGLGANWTSISRARRLHGRSLASAASGALLLGATALVVLPAPHPTQTVVFPTALGNDHPLPHPGAPVDGSSGTEPARRATSSGRTRIGGFLGFAGPLDTALRGSLGSSVVMRVRAARPTYWIGEIYDHWDGQSWTESIHGTRAVTTGSPFFIPATGNDASSGRPDLQTFYLAQAGPNLVFHADQANEVWFPAHSLYLTGEGSIRTGISMGAGTVYTVLSEVDVPAPEKLRLAGLSNEALPPVDLARYLQLPHAYARAAALARSVGDHAGNTYDKVEALIGWMGAHTRYSTDIPPLRPGQDAVDEFLFGNRTGYCEQIATSLAVMLRSLGVPARVATGFVPGPYNPITDLYDIQAKDAHAWVQVWFPGYGWQSFDPTAAVPDANPSPGGALLHDVLDALRHLPLLPVGSALGALAAACCVVLLRKRRPRSWAEKVAKQIEKEGARSGRPRAASETLSEYAAVIESLKSRDVEGGTAPQGRVAVLSRAAEASAYGCRQPPPNLTRGRTRVPRRRRRRTRRAPGNP